MKIIICKTNNLTKVENVLPLAKKIRYTLPKIFKLIFGNKSGGIIPERD